MFSKRNEQVILKQYYEIDNQTKTIHYIRLTTGGKCTIITLEHTMQGKKNFSHVWFFTKKEYERAEKNYIWLRTTQFGQKTWEQMIITNDITNLIKIKEV